LSGRSASLHAKHLFVLALAIAGAIPYGLHAVGSLAAGGGIQVLNLTVLERSVRARLGAGAAAPAAQVLLALRLLLFFVAVAWVLVATNVQPLAFLVGLLAVVPALIWHGLTAPAARIQ
jgi:hypothetical protein